MMQSGRSGAVSALAALAVVTGCALDASDPGREDSAARGEAIVGSVTKTNYPVVSVHMPEGRIHTGLILSERLILASHRAVEFWEAKEIRVRFWDLRAGTFEERTPTHLDFDATGEHVMIRLPKGFANGRPWNLVKAFDPETDQGAIDCVAFDPWRDGVLYKAWMQVSVFSPPTFRVVPGSVAGEHLEDEDRGAPCLQGFLGNTLGVSLGVPSPAFPEESEVLLLSALTGWITDMKNLDQVRLSTRKPLRLYYREAGGRDLCMKAGASPVVRGPCSASDPRERMYWYDLPRTPYYALVSEDTGKCVAVSGGALGTAQLVSETCDWGRPSQRFDLGLHDPQDTGLKVVTNPDFGDGRCLSSTSAPATAGAPLEQRACATGVTTNLDQRWYLRFR